MPVAFFDDKHNLLLKNNEYPSYCRSKCQVEKDLNNCILYSYKDNHVPPYYQDATAYVCPQGMSLYNLGIVYKNELLGYIWDEKAAEHGEERPIKTNDHACDALRYGVATLIYSKRRFMV